MASKGKGKKKNGYEMPKPLKVGDLLNDTQKKQWKIGVSIGVGGFGEIYSACKSDSSIKKVDDYPYVVKIEPKENGPLFVEMHFYMRNAKSEDITNFKKDHKLKSLGMPEFIASGSQEIQTIKHRFLVLPRFGQDIWKLFIANNNIFPLPTAFRLGWQITNVLEYIHSRDYVHADIKGSNILLGFGKGGDEQVYLLDYGLACKFDTTKDFKPDPKKMHNGTIEYTSRDAHQGVPSFRGDFEILAYNLIEWCGGKLPWVTGKILAKPLEVQKSKENFMKSYETSLKTAFGNTQVPPKVQEFLKLIFALKPTDKPDYNKIRNIFEGGIKDAGGKNSGALDFKMSQTKVAASKKKSISEIVKSADEGASKKITKRTKKDVPSKIVDSDTEPDEIVQISPKKKSTLKPKSPEKKKTATKGDDLKTQKRGRTVKKPAIIESESEVDDVEEVQRSPKKKARKEESKSTASSKENHNSPEASNKESQSVTLKAKTPSKNRKVIKLNLNLDVSLNSDLIVVLNRKDKKKTNNADQDANTSATDKDTPNRAGQYKGKKSKK